MLNDFAALRTREFRRLDEAGEVYLDYTGSALYPESLVTWHLEHLRRGVFGNPHSAHGPSRASARARESAAQAVLEFLDADPADYAVCFTANASAAIKLVAESFPFAPSRGLVLAADNHNSVNGIREYARRSGAVTAYLPLDPELRLMNAGEVLTGQSGRSGLFAFPAQSNFSGVRHSLGLVTRARALGYRVLLDAAALLPSHPLSLRQVPADFAAFSLYKIIGYPTGVGALVARRDALAELRRPWFAGGTVEFASVQHDTFLRRPGAEAFEDGTPDFLALSAVAPALGFLRTVGVANVSAHVGVLTRYLIESLVSLRHHNGRPMVRLYGPCRADSGGTCTGRGGAVAFNVLDDAGDLVPYSIVADRTASEKVALRGGCFCNPGAAESAFGRPADDVSRPAGAIRASVGLATNITDLDRAIVVIETFGQTQVRR